MIWLALILLLVALGAAVVREIGWALGAVFLAVLCLIAGSVHIVPTKNVGIVTAFNKPTGRTTGAGWQWTWPWENVDDWDARRQTYDHKHQNTCVSVRISGQRNACVEVQIEWSARPGRAPENWGLYGKTEDDQSRFEAFTARRVEPQFTAALNRVFASFDPLSTVDPKTGTAPAPDLNKLYSGPTRGAIETAIGADVQVDSLAFGFIHYDQATNDQLAEYGKKTLETRNLGVDQRNALLRKSITEQNAKVDDTARCLEIADRHGKEPGLCMADPVLTRQVN